MDLITQLPVPDRDTRLALNKNFTVLEVEDEKDDARLNREIQDRQAADVNLQGQIDRLGIRLTTAEGNINDLQKRIASLEEQVKKINGILFGMEYINETDEFPLDSSTPDPSETEINDDVAVDDDNAEVVKELPHEVISNEVS